MLELTVLKDCYSHFIKDSVCPLVFEMIDRIDNVNLWMQFNSSILMRSRQD